jgi:hypothetical protein
MNLGFPQQIFEKNTQIKNLMEIRLVGAELFHADLWTDRRANRQIDRQTELTKLIVAFRNLANAPKKTHIVPHSKLNESPLQTSMINVKLKVFLSASWSCTGGEEI